MRKTWGLLRAYPLVLASVLVLIATIVLAATGHDSTARWLASVYTIGIAAYMTVGMVRDILRGHWGIDILAVTAMVSTVAVGEYVAALIVVLMITGGDGLEDYASGRARHELTALLQRAPQTAHRIAGDSGDIEEVTADDVRVGDLLLIRPAEIVPVDGDLVSPSATFDESSLTGEGIPVERTTGDSVMSGSVNGETAVQIRATALARDSQYHHIISLVQQAADSRAPVVRLADRYAVPFTAVAYLIAVIAWIVARDPVRFAEVLVVATPCPLLIAAPVAFIAGMSRAAHAGVIVKSGATIETLARIRTAAFDKTGTLTQGRPGLESVNVAGPFDADTVLRLAASAEQYSSHVLAASVISAARERGLELETADWAEELATNGVIARFGGREVVVGKPRFVAEHASGLHRLHAPEGQLVIYVGVGGSFAGTLSMSDPLRPEAAATLEQLQQLGVERTLMLTGDVAPTAQHIADRLGITEVRAELLPADKVRAISEVHPRPVMMVGDGVNDAPVLAAADVGVAMGARGSTAASESADVVIMLDDLSRTARAVAIGRRTVRIGLQSIWLGIALSVALMFIAAFGVIPAIVGAILQEFVDLASILNALRALAAGRSERQAPRATEPTAAVAA